MLREQTAVLSPLAGAAAQTAVGFMPDAMQFWFTGTVTPVGQVIDIPTGPGMSGSLGGSGAVQANEYTDSAGAAIHGMLFVHIATNGEAAGVNVSTAGQPPAVDPTDPAWNLLVNYMWVVALSLCPPDGAGAFCFALGGP